jgi:DNA sulfur modification protein DndC
LYKELRLFGNRLQKDGERLKSGRLSSNPNRKGPLTMDARRYGLSVVLSVQSEINLAADKLGREHIDLINADEEARILELIALNQWPDRWDGTEPRGDVLIPQTLGEGIVQPIMFD